MSCKQPMTGMQLTRFQTALTEADVAAGAHRLVTSIGNSAAILGWPRCAGRLGAAGPRAVWRLAVRR